MRVHPHRAERILGGQRLALPGDDCHAARRRFAIYAAAVVLVAAVYVFWR